MAVMHRVGHSPTNAADQKELWDAAAAVADSRKGARMATPPRGLGGSTAAMPLPSARALQPAEQAAAPHQEVEYLPLNQYKLDPLYRVEVGTMCGPFLIRG